MRGLIYNIWGIFTYSLLYPYAEKKQGRDILSKLEVLRLEAALPFVERRKQAQKRLAAALGHAGATVPYYRELFAKRGFDPADVLKDIRYFEDLPYLSKDILREQGRRLISEDYSGKIVREQKTGSSTGPAAIIYYDQESLDWTAAQNILMLEWGGKRRYNREAHLSTRFADTRRPKYPDFEAKKCFVLNRYNIYTSGFDDASQERLLEDLRTACARVVQGHPSSMFALARWLKKNNRAGAGLFEIFVSTGEMLSAAQRDLIEEVFAARVSNRYGACEYGVMAQERKDGPKGKLMVSDSMVWPEVIAEAKAGSAATAEGTAIDRSSSESSGELVFTALRNPAMPLIRYRMGDLGSLAECEDGWWISDLAGRVHDAVEIGGVSCPTHYIQDILDRCGPISDFQIAVKDGKAAELRLVAEPEAWEGIEAAVRANFPTVPVRRIKPEELVFTGVRGKFSYLLREN